MLADFESKIYSKILITIKAAHSCCFSRGGTLKNDDFLSPKAL